MPTLPQLGITPVTNESAMQGPEQITEHATKIAAELGKSVAAPANLPASGSNWVARLIYAISEKCLYLWSGSEWLRMQRVHASAVGEHAAATSTGGGSAPVFWSDPQVVTFPTGRFSVPPIASVTAVDSSSVVWAHIVDVSATQLRYRLFRIGAVPSAGMKVHWMATQMDSGTAAG